MSVFCAIRFLSTLAFVHGYHSQSELLRDVDDNATSTKELGDQRLASHAAKFSPADFISAATSAAAHSIVTTGQARVEKHLHSGSGVDWERGSDVSIDVKDLIGPSPALERLGGVGNTKHKDGPGAKLQRKHLSPAQVAAKARNQTFPAAKARARGSQSAAAKKPAGNKTQLPEDATVRQLVSQLRVMAEAKETDARARLASVTESLRKAAAVRKSTASTLKALEREEELLQAARVKASEDLTQARKLRAGTPKDAKSLASKANAYARAEDAVIKAYRQLNITNQKIARAKEDKRKMVAFATAAQQQSAKLQSARTAAAKELQRAKKDRVKAEREDGKRLRQFERLAVDVEQTKEARDKVIAEYDKAKSQLDEAIRQFRAPAASEQHSLPPKSAKAAGSAKDVKAAKPSAGAAAAGSGVAVEAKYPKAVKAHKPTAQAVKAPKIGAKDAMEEARAVQAEARAVKEMAEAAAKEAKAGVSGHFPKHDVLAMPGAGGNSTLAKSHHSSTAATNSTGSSSRSNSSRSSSSSGSGSSRHNTTGSNIEDLHSIINVSLPVVAPA